MKSFSKFIVEDDDTELQTDARKAVQALIVSNLNRIAASSDPADNRSILMLNAALSMLAISDDAQTINQAKRIAQMALMKVTKTKKDK